MVESQYSTTRPIVVEERAAERIPETLALRYGIVALACDGNFIDIAVARGDDTVLDRVRLATGLRVRLVDAPPADVEYACTRYYGTQEPRTKLEAPAVTALAELQTRAIAARASDIHFEPDDGGGRVRFRVDGSLREASRFSAETFLQLSSRLKLLAGLDIAERRLPQDGRYSTQAAGRGIEIRVSSMPTLAGEKIVARLLDSRTPFRSLDALGMPPDLLQSYREALAAPHGFIVVCGPTGSGKTTTLYASLAERNVESESLVSVEDPVEVRLPGVAQVQVHRKAGLTFAGALRAFLRQDPNVVMIGEMRDAETTEVALSASLTGQLVLTSLHARSAPHAIRRLQEMGASNHALAASLNVVLGQRLIPRGTGSSGREAIFEALFVTDALREAIASGASTGEISRLAALGGYVPLSPRRLSKDAA